MIGSRLALALAMVWAFQSVRAEVAPSGFVPEMHDVQLLTLASVLADATGQKIIVSDAVAATAVTHFPASASADEAQRNLLFVLNSKGVASIEADGITYLVERASAPAPLWSPSATDQDWVTKIIPLRHVSALEVARLLARLAGSEKQVKQVVSFADTNQILISDTVANIRRFEQIIEQLDRPGAARTIEVISLKNVPANEVAAQLTAAIRLGRSAEATLQERTQMKDDGRGSLPANSAVIAAPQANSLILVGTSLQIQELKDLITRLDVASPSGYGRMNAIFLKYLTAEDAAKSLNALLAKTVAKDEQSRISIEHSTPNNALIVDAAPQDFEAVQKLVRELDQVPQQVLVEVVIAEVSYDNDTELGVELSTVESPADGENTFMGRTRPGPQDLMMGILRDGIYPQGAALGVARGTSAGADGSLIPNIPVLLTALAKDRDVRILSSVPIWAQNNTEASVNVVENIPILRSTIEGGAGTSRDVIQNIDRMDVGIKLRVTPHVNPEREIRLRLEPSIESIVSQGEQFAPIISKRSVSNTVTVPDRSTVVITGLMREDEVEELSKVPFLGDIPGLGWLFRYKATAKRRTNLLIFATPRIVTDMEEADRLREELKARTGLDSQKNNHDAKSTPPSERSDADP